MESAALSGRNALGVMAGVGNVSTPVPPYLMTELKRHVLDVCEAIKQVDNLLRANAFGLVQLLEIVEADPGELGWRDLVALRDVLAFRLLTTDGEGTVRSAARRDFATLCEFLGRVYFVPVKTDFGRGKYLSPLLETPKHRFTSCHPQMVLQPRTSRVCL